MALNMLCKSTIIQKIFEFLYQIAHYRKSSISAFQEIFTSTDKIFFLGGELRTRQ